MSNISPLTISYSEVFKWDTCQRQYYYRFIKNLSPLDESEAMTTGTKGHKLLQSFYGCYKAGMSKLDSLKETQDRAKKLLEAETFADTGLLTAWILVDNYIRGTEFVSEPLLVENRFIIPFSVIDSDPAYSHVQIGFTPDVVFERSGGFLDVEDSKFIQKAWSEKKINRFPQAKLYQILLRQMGYNISRSTIRFFNVKTGKITYKNYELLPEESQTLVSDFTAAVKEVVKFRNQEDYQKQRARRTMNYTACQFCAFEIPCTLEAEGKSAEKTFKNFFKQSDYSYDH